MKTLIFISILFLFASCNGSKNKVTVSNVKFDSLAHDYYCSIDEKKQVVVKNDAEYRKIWDEVYMNLDQMPRIPDVDFEKYTVVAVFMGIQKSGGFDIKITNISGNDEKLIVDVTETSPGVNCMVTDAITKPYEFVKIKKTDKKIEFKIYNTTKDCQ